jgi:6-phosphogluconolactonase
VPESSERSNAKLVRDTLLVNKAAAAKFVPLADTDAAAALPPFDVTVLGMGSDGHTASFFPGGDMLAEAVNSNTQARIVAMTAPGAGEPRLTFTLPVLEATGRLKLHIEGAEKRAVLEKALADGPTADMPVRAVLRSATPMTLYWCP